MGKVKVKETTASTGVPVLYVPRPVPVEALRYSEENRNELLDFIGSRASVSSSGFALILRTPGFTVTVCPGDWLLFRGSRFETLDDASFHVSYEPAPKK